MERVYEVLNKQVFTNGDYRLVPIRSEDRYLIMRWRNDQMYHLRQSELLTIVSQDEYFNNVVNQLFNERNPSQIIFSLLINDSCVGYGGLVHLDWNSKSAEISLLIGTEYEQNYFDTIWGHYLQMIQEVAFNDLGLNKIYTYAFDLRPNLYPLLESNKFTKEAVLTNHVKIDNSYVNVVIHSKFNPLSKETKNFGILVTSVSDKVSLIKDVRQAINDLRLNANLLGCDIRDSNVSKFF